MMPVLINYSRQRLINKDHAIDVAHMAFEMALQYVREKDGRVSPFILYRNADRICKKRNKVDVFEIPMNVEEAESEE
jgi:hypothetical protein